MKRQNRHILALFDNAPSHIFDKSKLTHVTVEFLEPNMTSHIQPMDAGIIRAFKAHYRRLYIERVLERDEFGEDNIYHIDQLEGMRLLEHAWESVTSSTVAHCWTHSGILRGPDEVVSIVDPVLTEPECVKKAVNDLQDSLSRLVLTGQIAPRDVPTVEELISNTAEKETEAPWSDQDIVDQVRINEIEDKGETVAELDDTPPPDAKPLMSLGDARRSVNELLRLYNVREGEKAQNFRNMLALMKHDIQHDVIASQRQTNISDFYSINSTEQ
jgi:hypothetical protein